MRIEIGAELRKLVEHGVVRIQIFRARHVIVVPHHHDLAAAVFIRDVRAHARKRRLIDRREQQKRLPFLNVDADFHQQFCVLFELVFHSRFLSEMFILPLPPSR